MTPAERTFPPPMTESDLARQKRNSRIELAICLFVALLALIAMAAFG
jgi:hypothetical protein